MRSDDPRCGVEKRERITVAVTGMGRRRFVMVDCNIFILDVVSF